LKALVIGLVIITLLTAGVASYVFVQLEDLRVEYAVLKRSYASLNSTYNRLREDYNSLMSKYEALSHSYNELLTNYSTLSNRYELIYAYTRDRAGLMDTLPKYIDYLSPEVSNAVTEAMKAWIGNPYTKIYNWVKSHVRYNYDTPLVVPNPISSTASYTAIRNYVQYASETVRLGRGDCEYQAILVAAMVLNYWLRTEGKTYLIYVVIVRGHEKSSEPAGHAFTVIPVKGGKIVILDPAGSQITGLDLWVFRIVEAKDIYVAIKDYVNNWANIGIHWTRVEAVFNQNTYERLDMSIDQFIAWLYEITR